jgi:hypothetical protein
MSKHNEIESEQDNQIKTTRNQYRNLKPILARPDDPINKLSSAISRNRLHGTKKAEEGEVITALRSDSLFYGMRNQLVGKRVEVLLLHPVLLAGGYRYAKVRVLKGPLRGRELYIVGVKFKTEGD